jgi:O-antigen/teichoic acid export membrane protein
VTSADSETPSSAATPVATGLRDGVALGLSKLAAAFLAVIALKAVLHVTDAYEYGRYIVFLPVANFAIAFMAWPVASVLRLGTEEHEATRKLSRTYVLHVLLVLGSMVLLAAPLWRGRELVDRFVNVGGATAVVLAYGLVTALANVTGALLKPAGKVAAFAILPLVTRVAYVGALGYVALRRETVDAFHVMLICLVTAIPQLLTGLAIVARRVLPPRLPHVADAERALHFGLPVLLRQLGAQAFASVNPLVIRELRNFVEAGYINVPGTISEQTALLGVAFEDLMGPILAKAATKGEARVLDTYFRTLAPQVVLGWSIACGAALILAHPILVALSAKEVAVSGIVLQVLFLATATRILVPLEAPVFDAHLISTPPLVFFALGLATNLGLDFLLIPRNGMEGAAWATVAGWLVNVLLRSGYLRLRFQVPTLRLYLALAPAVAAFAYARVLGGRLALDVGVALGFALGSVLLAKALGFFPRATLEALEAVRMPARLRAFLVWFYGAPPPPATRGEGRGGGPL